MEMKRAASPKGPLVHFNLSSWNTMLQECCAHLGLEPIHPCVLRHSGPSGDYLRRRRSLMDIQRRGRWAVESSVRRYTKAARNMSQMSTWTSEMVGHLHRCEQEI